MSKNIIQTIKDQITGQTREHANINLDNVPIVPIDSRTNVDTPEVSVVGVTPNWTHIVQQVSGSYVVSPDELLKSSFRRYVEELSGSSIVVKPPEMTDGTRHFFGTDIYTANKDVQVSLTVASSGGYLGVYSKQSDGSDWSVIYEQPIVQTVTTTNQTIRLAIPQYSWQSIAITFVPYDSDPAVGFTGVWTGVGMQRPTSIRSYTNSLTAPTWAANPMQQELDPQTGKYSVLLSWNKSTNEDIAGYGVYREAVVSSGVTVAAFIPGTLFSATGKPRSFRSNWFAYFGGLGTISPFDTIYFGDPTATLGISDVVLRKPNKIPNPIFSNGNTHWVLSTNATIKNTSFSKVGSAHVNFDGMLASNGSIQLTSGYYISVNPTLNYTIEFGISQNLLSKHPFGLGGYGVSASRWTVSSGVSSITATLDDITEYAEVLRGNTDGYFRVENNAFYVSTLASLTLTTAASFAKEDYYKISIHDKDDTELYNTGTLWASHGYKSFVRRFTPSASGTAYIKVTVPGTTSYTNFATLHFRNISLSAQSTTGSITDLFTLVFLNGFFAACGTPLATINIAQPASRLSRYNFSVAPINRYMYDTVLGTLRATATISPYIPKDCEYLQIKYKTKSLSASEPLPIRREIHFAGMYVGERPDSYFSVFATQSVWVKTTSTLTTTVGSIINFVAYDHLADRPKMESDASVIKWTDYDVVVNEKYKYYLDNYDNSAFVNRSPFSAVASLTIADITAPKAPTGYTIVPVPGAVQHRWTNPTAQDLAYVSGYSDSDCQYKIFELRSSPGSLSNFTETTTTASVSVKRVLRANDIYGNLSPTISVTGTLLPEKPTDLSFTITMKDGSGQPIYPNNNGWYNSSAIVASLLYEGTNAIASMFSSVRNVGSGGAWSVWGVFDGTTEIYGSGIYGLRYYVKDIYNNNSAPSESFVVKFDDTKPAWGSQKSRFWDGPNCKSFPGYNSLKWNDTVPTDNLSQVYQYHIRKHQIIGTTTADPGFDSSIVGNLTNNVAWSREGGVSFGTFLIEDNQSVGFYNKKHIKLIAEHASGYVSATLVSSAIKVESGDNVFGMFRFAVASMGGLTNVKLAVRDADTKSVLASMAFKNLSLSPTFQYGQVSYSSGGSATVQLTVTATSLATPPNQNDFMYIDEMLMTVNPVLSTINKVAAGDYFYTDTDVISWGRYLYAVVPEDYAGNLGTISDYKYMRSIANVRDSYRNMLNNSSFERSHFSNATLWPDNWDSYLLGANNTKTQYNKDSQVVTSEQYYGNQCLLLNGGVSGVVFQNNVTLLPYTGDDRLYVISAYAKKPASSSALLVLGGLIKNTDGTTVLNKNTSFNLTNSWVRYTATINQTVASMQQISVYLAGSSVGTIYVDAVQLEDNNDGVASYYYDTTSVTADYIQGALIRGHNIEADSIYTNHLQAGVITAEKLSANSVAASNIKANTLTTNELSLANADIFLRSHYVSGRSLAAATVFNYYSSFGTVRPWSAAVNPTLSGYYTIHECTDSGVDKVALTIWGHYLYSPQSLILPSAIYSKNAGYPKIAVTYPYSTTGTGLIAVRSAGGTIYTAYGTFSKNRHLLNTAAWSGVTEIIADGNFYNTDLVYNGGNFFMNTATTNNVTPTLHLIKLDHQGKNPVVYRKAYAMASLVLYSSLCKDANGTLLLATAFYSWGGVGCATISLSGYNKNGISVIPTVQIGTYNGLSNLDRTLYGGARAGVGRVSMQAIKSNKFFLTYTIVGHYIYYYKILDSNLNVLVGQNRDLILFAWDKDKFGAGAVPKLQGVWTEDNDITYQYSVGATLYSNIMQRSTGTVNLQELLNRLT